MKAQNRSLSILSFSRISCFIVFFNNSSYLRSKPQWHYFVVKPGVFNIFLMFTKQLFQEKSIWQYVYAVSTIALICNNQNMEEW